MVSGLILGLWSIWSWCLCTVRCQDLVSFSCRQPVSPALFIFSPMYSGIFPNTRGQHFVNLYLGPHCILLIYVSVWGGRAVTIALQSDLRSSMMNPPVLILLLSVVVGVVSLTEPRITWEEGLWERLWWIVLITLNMMMTGKTCLHCGSDHSLSKGSQTVWVGSCVRAERQQASVLSCFDCPPRRATPRTMGFSKPSLP